MRAATIVKGRLVFLEGDVPSIVEALNLLFKTEYEICFLQPPDKDTDWEAIREMVKGVINL